MRTRFHCTFLAQLDSNLNCQGKIELFEAKQKLSELVDQVMESRAEGKLATVLSPPPARVSLEAVFKSIEQVRRDVNRKQTFRVREHIEKGRI